MNWNSNSGHWTTSLFKLLKYSYFIPTEDAERSRLSINFDPTKNRRMVRITCNFAIGESTRRTFSNLHYVILYLIQQFKTVQELVTHFIHTETKLTSGAEVKLVIVNFEWKREWVSPAHLFNFTSGLPHSHYHVIEHAWPTKRSGSNMLCLLGVIKS